ncbi:uncharacterized protein LOC127453884 [Myxocyprinus asiaticus]|uniref:uncharacterized protein LOC127453884 n=1 Tax=Myxocyprinus asiaticus TaxID=70543 RepID=UPI002223CAAD|nr:uncharacterized protein LOC127453884 [Myxocyprinus asiaticus]
MVPSQQKLKSLVMKSALSFVFGAVAGGTLGATEVPVNQVATEIVSGTLLKPITDGMKTVGALGLGTLLGATALTTSMTAAVIGITIAASVGLLLLRTPAALGGITWTAAGLTAALATTSSGAALGAIIEKLVSYGVVNLLWALGIFTVLKLLMHIVVQFTCRERDCCGIQGVCTEDSESEQVRLDALEVEQRQRVAVEIEQRIIALEMVKTGEEGKGLELRATWEAQRRKREEVERQQWQALEVEMKQRISRRHLLKVVGKYVEFLVFSGIPMTVTASVTAGFGIFGFGDYRFVFVILLVLVLIMSFGLMRSRHLDFWMFTGCMAMFATFAIAVLTVHAGQEVAGMSVKMHKAGQAISKQNISIRIMHTSSVEAISAGFFVSKVSQVGLGATVGGPMGREAGGKAIVGACVTAVAVLSLVEVSSQIVGVGGTAGAFLGAVGAAGVAMGGAAAVAVKSSSWGGILATTAGIFFGFLVFGKWDIVNIGLQVSVAYIFAMTNLY